MTKLRDKIIKEIKLNFIDQDLDQETITRGCSNS